MANSKTHSEERDDNGYGETSEGPGTIQGLIILEIIVQLFRCLPWVQQVS